ncbi:hypothetical protein K488DRAFT_73616 [Vararia minispora EC-137]|uniref:Uncharacterized protein n=1 Tax=Vararia minispora EC-137 TaxID=1314806 RepID=A0ACB8QA90_9AGAM|nr:hypothetical protein K488DRAFT_73616 [Vararia minispora EC-137]
MDFSFTEAILVKKPSARATSCKPSRASLYIAKLGERESSACARRYPTRTTTALGVGQDRVAGQGTRAHRRPSLPSHAPPPSNVPHSAIDGNAARDVDDDGAGVATGRGRASAESGTNVRADVGDARPAADAASIAECETRGGRTKNGARADIGTGVGLVGADSSRERRLEMDPTAIVYGRDASTWRRSLSSLNSRGLIQCTFFEHSQAASMVHKSAGEKNRHRRLRTALETNPDRCLWHYWCTGAHVQLPECGRTLGYRMCCRMAHGYGQRTQIASLPHSDEESIPFLVRKKRRPPQTTASAATPMADFRNVDLFMLRQDMMKAERLCHKYIQRAAKAAADATDAQNLLKEVRESYERLEEQKAELIRIHEDAESLLNCLVELFRDGQYTCPLCRKDITRAPVSCFVVRDIVEAYERATEGGEMSSAEEGKGKGVASTNLHLVLINVYGSGDLRHCPTPVDVNALKYASLRETVAATGTAMRQRHLSSKPESDSEMATI